MHAALQIPELLHLIFVELYSTGKHQDLLSYCLTCKAFNEPALDVIWADLPSITAMPFAPDEERLDSKSSQFNETLYSRYVDRLKFYGRRVRTLRVDSQLTPHILKCIRNVERSSPSTLSLSPWSTIFPALQVLDISVTFKPSDAPRKRLRVKTFIKLFLRPTVRGLHLHFRDGSSYSDLINALAQVNFIRPSLTYLTLDSDKLGSPFGPQSPMLHPEFTPLIKSSPHLEELHLTLPLLTHPVVVAVASMPRLRHLKISCPTGIEWGTGHILRSVHPPFRIPTESDSFNRLRSIAITASCDAIPWIFTSHEGLASNISRLALTYVNPPSQTDLYPLFPPDLSPHAFQFLTHISFDFVSQMGFHMPFILDGQTLFSLLSNPLVSRLVSFRIRLRRPPLINDSQYEKVARAMPNLESICILVVPPRSDANSLSPVSINASLAALVSFSTHCPKLREITLPLNAEELSVPVLTPGVTPVFTHAVIMDMSVSIVDSSLFDVVEFLATIFPHENCGLTSYWLTSDWAAPQGPAYSRRWKAIVESTRKQRRIQGKPT